MKIWYDKLLIGMGKGAATMKNGSWKQTALLLTGAFVWNLPIGACADLSLEQAVSLALQQNTSIKITQKGEETAAATLKEAKGGKGFSVTASSGLSTSKTNGSEANTGLSTSLTAELPVYSGGKTDASISSGELGVKSAVLSTKREREDIKLKVITAYYNALEAKKTVNVDQESVDNYQAHLTNVQQLYSAGSKARIDVLSSSVELSNARQTLIKAQNAYEVDLATLRNILNIDRNEPLNLTDDVVYAPFDRDMNACVDYAYQNRKDLKVDAYTLEQKELSVKMAEAGLKPTLKLSLGTSLANQFSPSKDDRHTFEAGINASWNVFDSGVTRAEIDAAKTARDVARLNLNKDRDDVDLTVRQAYYNMKEAEKRFTSTGDAINQAKENYYIAREKYRAGEGLMLDIIDAQLSLSTAELNYITAQYDYARYKATLENAMGIGLSEAQKKAAGEESGEKAVAPAVKNVMPETAAANNQKTAANVTAESNEVANAAGENGGES